MPFPKIENFKIVKNIDKRICVTRYEALDQRDGKQILLKVLDKKLSDNENIVHNFLSSARITRILDNPQICKIYDFGSSHGHHFIASELIQGESLSLLSLESSLWPYQELLDIFLKIGLTLRFSHLRGVAHGLLNPGCIYVASDGSIKIDDFGFYWYLPYLIQKSDAESLYLSHFISPEAYKGIDKLDSRSDIYSLNVILFHLITENFPYKDQKSAALEKSLFGEPLPSLRAYITDFPIELENIISKSLNKNPDQRFQNFKEFVDEVELVKNELSGTAKKVDDTGKAFILTQVQNIITQSFSKILHNLSSYFSTLLRNLTIYFTSVFFKNKYVLSGLGVLIFIVIILSAFNFQIPFLTKTESVILNDVASPDTKHQSEFAKIEVPQLTTQKRPTITHPDSTVISAVDEADGKESEPGITSDFPGIEAAEKAEELPIPSERVVEEQPSVPEPIVANLVVKSKNRPIVANIFIDGQFRGKTNRQGKIQIRELEPNRSYEVKVSKKGYLTATKSFRATKGTQLLSIDLKPSLNIFGTLILDAIPQADSILIDGKLYRGNPPLKISLAAGKHRVRFVNSKLNASWEKEVNIIVGQEIRIAHDFYKVEFGSVAVSLKNAADYGFGFVYVDGKIWRQKSNTTPLNIRLPVGLHTISVRREGFISIPKDTTIMIEKEAAKYLSFIFKKKE